ncbi:MAG: S8 family serine peptidase [Planctomycetes bacterium]|nr:S8 family serine peptidase [Planctomycetota bacterium]
MPNRSSIIRKNVFRQVRLQYDELEARDVPSAALPDITIDHDQYATDHILVRWLDDQPVQSNFSAGLEDLGNNTYSVRLADGVSVADAIDYYGQLSGVDFAQADFVINVARTSNDPYASSQWALSAIGAQTAWNYTTGSNTIIVAVIDTGVNYLHSDLAANIWRNAGEIAGNGRDDDGNGYVDDSLGYDFVNNDSDPLDDNGHGTHVAGIIGAVGNNGVGVSGVNWNVKIMSLKFMNAAGSGYLSNAVKAVNYAVQMGAKVLNNSWGGGGYDAAMASAIQNAQNRGVIFVAAAGNSGANNDVTPAYPANYSNSNVISVAASDSNNNLATFSNYGAGTVDIAAPGVSILSTYLNNQYAYYSGTSMATPYVAGALALVWSQNPTWSYSQVIASVLNNTTRPAGLAGKVTTGLLNVGNAVTAGAPVQTPPPVQTPAPSISSASFAGGTNYFNSLRVNFAGAINPATFTADDVFVTDPSGARVNVTSISAVAGSNNSQFNVYFATQTRIGAYQVVIGPDIRDSSNRLMDQNKNGVSGETADRFTFSGNLGGSQTFASGTLNQAIADQSTLTSTITINQHVPISSLVVNLSIKHTYDSDLSIMLVSPTGKSIYLFYRRGGSGDNLTNTTFSDAATTAIANGAAPFNGTYKPENALSAFQNLDAYGTWKLVITDMARYDTGTLVNWSITLSSTTNVSRAASDGGESNFGIPVTAGDFAKGTNELSGSFSAGKGVQGELVAWISTPNDSNKGFVNQANLPSKSARTPRESQSESTSTPLARLNSTILHGPLGEESADEVDIDAMLDALFVEI